MRDIRSDLRERLEMVIRRRKEMSQQLEALDEREQRLRALLCDEGSLPEEPRQLELVPPLPTSNGARLRQFVYGSLANGDDWSLEELKEHAHRMGLNGSGASGRSLNITLVNLLREDSVIRLPGGRWRLSDQRKQLALDFARPSSTCRAEDARFTRAS